MTLPTLTRLLLSSCLAVAVSCVAPAADAVGSGAGGNRSKSDSLAWTRPKHDIPPARLGPMIVHTFGDVIDRWGAGAFFALEFDGVLFSLQWEKGLNGLVCSFKHRQCTVSHYWNEGYSFGLDPFGVKEGSKARDRHRARFGRGPRAVAGAGISAEAVLGVAMGFENGVHDWYGWFRSVETEVGVHRFLRNFFKKIPVPGWLRDLGAPWGDRSVDPNSANLDTLAGYLFLDFGIPIALFTGGTDIDQNGRIDFWSEFFRPERTGISGLAVGADITLELFGNRHNVLTVAGYWSPVNWAIRWLNWLLGDWTRLIDPTTPEPHAPCPDDWGDWPEDRRLCVLEWVGSASDFADTMGLNDPDEVR